MLTGQRMYSIFKMLSITVVSMVFLAQEVPASALAQKNDKMAGVLFTNTKPQCIGRYLIDVPESFNNQLRDMVFIDDFKIESKPIYAPAFRQRITLREKELQDSINKPGNAPENAPFLKEVIRLPNDKGVIFDRNISGDDDLGRVLEAHVYVNSVAFIITTEILDLSSPKYIERKKMYVNAGFTEAEMNTKPAKLVAIQSLITRLSGRKDEEIPTDKGLCIPNGFIKDDGRKHKEKLSFTYENDDLIFGLETDNTMLGSDDTLPNRSAQINEALELSNKHTIKKGKLSPGGIPSQEWLFGGEQKSNKIKGQFPIYEFIFFSNESVATPTAPWLSIGLNNEDKNTRYTESQMVEIWDRLVGSLRYRPNAF